MKKIEIGLISLLVVAVVFKFLDYLFGNLLAILSFLTLSSFYFYLSFALFNTIGFRRIFRTESYQRVSVLKIIGSILVGFAISIVLIGMLFKIMMWAIAGLNLIVGILGLVISLVVILVKLVKTKISILY